MARQPRCLAPGIACHITQRGVDRRETFSSIDDRNTYLELLRLNLADAEVRLLAWCLGRTGHLWQNRYFACMLAQDHLWTAIVYVERNPLRAGIVGRAEQYIWSSAIAHVAGKDPTGLLDMDWWQRSGHRNWARVVNRKRREVISEQSEDHDTLVKLRGCTYSGQPFGNEAFVDQMSEQYRRQWSRGRPSKAPSHGGLERRGQYALFHSGE